ncbi:MAG: chalcone isomerase family protein, partial [Burkholderiaceae bacterium]
EGVRSGSVGSSRFVLDLRYAKNLDGESIAEASLKEMQKIGAGSTQQQQVWLAKMKTIFPNVKKGTHISGVYLPDQGARFYLDGKFLSEVPDPAFARAFFGIWLDPKTSDKKLRSALLSGPADQ